MSPIYAAKEFLRIEDERISLNFMNNMDNLQDDFIN
jgi:hypothetical protein